MNRPGEFVFGLVEFSLMSTKIMYFYDLMFVTWPFKIINCTAVFIRLLFIAKLPTRSWDVNFFNYGVPN